MPLPGTHVIHPGMLGSLRPTAAATLVDECTIVRPSPEEPTYDAETRRSTPADPADVYSGPCRVQPRPTDERVVDAGETPTSLRSYYVELPWDAPPIAVDDVVTVTVSADGDLVGRALRVVDVAYTTLQVIRHLVCEDDLG